MSRLGADDGYIYMYSHALKEHLLEVGSSPNTSKLFPKYIPLYKYLVLFGKCIELAMLKV